MARYTGPKQKKSRAFGEPIFGPSKAFDRKKYRPGMHGQARRRKQPSDYANQLMEKQKAKYTYGVLERQFRNLFERANASKGVTGTVLLQLLESRLDNLVYRMGLAPTRRAARQLVAHKHIVVDGIVTNVPSTHVRVGQVIGVRGKSKNIDIIQDAAAGRGNTNFPWIEYNQDKMEGQLLALPERDDIPEKINEQLIVELYSK